ncbi:MAG: LysE family translocator [Methanolinea sp.]|nr:LysE family translocator [Methanolinea sp.]
MVLKTYLLGLVIGLTGALVPGPTLVATINTSVTGGWKTGARVSAGHALVEALVFSAIILGVSSVTAVSDFSGLIGAIGGIALVAFGILTIRGAGSGVPGEGSPGSVVANPYLAGAVTSVSNPYFWLWWFSVGSALVLAAAQQAFLFAVAFLAGHWSADFGWYTIVSASIHRGKRLFDDRVYAWVLRGCGAFLVLFGLSYLAFALESAFR